MTNITIYTTNYCPYCVKAKQLLKSKGTAFEEVDITEDHDMRLKLVEMTGGQKTVPQIFINEQHIGGSDALVALNSSGKLDAMLAS